MDHPFRARAALAIAAPLVLAACAASRPPEMSPVSLDRTAWVLASLPGTALAPGVTPTLRFDGGRVSGTDGCNRYTGPWTGDATTLRIGPNLASTRIACPDPAGAIATAFVRVLPRAATWHLDDATLVLRDASGATLATFAPQATVLAGTSWNVTGYNTGYQSVTGVREGTRITLEFTPQGGVRGSGGCNTYSGRWTMADGRLSIGPLRTTRMACPDPPDRMMQETAFLRALETVASARREGDRLELRTASGAIAAVAVAADAR